jgi:hypothetical protein
MRGIRGLVLILSSLALAVPLTACTGDDEPEAGASTTSDTTTDNQATGNPLITFDEAGCTFDGDTTPKAPTFMLDVRNLGSNWVGVAVNRVPADVSDEDVEAFFAAAQEVLAQGGEFAGPPKAWHLLSGGGGATGTASFRIGDDLFPEKMLVPGQRYVLWCSLGQPPTDVFFVTTLKPTE